RVRRPDAGRRGPAAHGGPVGPGRGASGGHRRCGRLRLHGPPFLRLERGPERRVARCRRRARPVGRLRLRRRPVRDLGVRPRRNEQGDRGRRVGRRGSRARRDVRRGAVERVLRAAGRPVVGARHRPQRRPAASAPSSPGPGQRSAGRRVVGCGPTHGAARRMVRL
ncbi:MAG: hypothetical protein AVDCRST_MAG08-3516, partial [uncultured Acetobacteraceae bacterium]